MVGEHMLIMGNDFTTGQWCAECSCGWEGLRQHDDQEGATDEWENHCDVVFMEATGVRDV